MPEFIAAAITAVASAGGVTLTAAAASYIAAGSVLLSGAQLARAEDPAPALEDRPA